MPSFVESGTSFTESGTSFVGLGTSFVGYEKPFVESGTSFVGYGKPLVEYGKPFVESGTSFVEVGISFVESGTSFVGCVIEDCGCDIAVLLLKATEQCFETTSFEERGAGGNGHMAMLVQDAKGNWYHFSQGAAEQGSTSGMVSNSGYTGGVMIQPMITKKSAGDIVQMTKEQAIAMVNTGRVDGNAYDENITLKTTKTQDGQIYSNALSLQKAYEKQRREIQINDK